MDRGFHARPGAVLSADIAVPGHERLAKFYAHVLSTGDRPLWKTDLMNNRGRPVIGIGEKIPQYAHLPLQWMPHIQVSGVAASVERAAELGGEVLMHQKAADGASQWAVLKDPNGAAFGVIPVVSAGALPKNDAGDESPQGRLAWLDLTVNDTATTREFYRQVVGWTVEDVTMQDDGQPFADYNMLDAAGQPAAGVCHARGVNVGLPAVWMLYLPVGDLGESLRRVEAGGGKVVKSLSRKDGAPVYAAIQDPAGAHFALVPA